MPVGVAGKRVVVVLCAWLVGILVLVWWVYGLKKVFCEAFDYSEYNHLFQRGGGRKQQ